jgi:cytochrome c oxidase subunit IV
MKNTNTNNITVKPVNKERIKKILNTTLLLSVVTSIEFLLTFTLPRSSFLIFLLVSLTFVKAFYIVAEFMHLKYEVKGLILCISLPTIFLT